MFYQLVKSLIKGSLLIFFKKIEVIGREHLPENGPVIIVANHPSAAIDPLIIGILSRRKLHFVAAAEYFGKGLRAKLFKEQFNMIPVYRPWLSKTKEASNTDMFRDCYAALEKGSCIVIFPEASSRTTSRIREVKSGAIRIKLGFEDMMNGKVEVPVIPIGLNYSDAHRFRSQLIIKIGAPIDFEEHDIPRPEQVKAMTHQMQEALKETIFHVDREDLFPLVVKVTRIFISTVRAEARRKEQPEQANFRYIRDIAEAVGYFEQRDKKGFEEMNQQIDNYLDRLDELGLDVHYLDTDYKFSPGWLLLFLVVSFPFFLLGMCIYLPAYLLTRMIFTGFIRERIDKDYDQGRMNPSFTGSVIFGVGVVILLVWSVILSVFTGWVFESWIAGIAVAILTFPLVRFTLFYILRTQNYIDHLRSRNVARKHAPDLKALHEQREALIIRLREYRRQFDALKGNGE